MTVITPERMIIAHSRPDDPCGPSRAHWISEAGGLTQFGAFIHVLAPGARTSFKHWHSAEDELVYVLEGVVTLDEGESETLLRAGDAATFKAGDPVGHRLVNRSAQDVRLLVVGTRAPADTITYPDHDRVCRRERAAPDDSWFDGKGNRATNPYIQP